MEAFYQSALLMWDGPNKGSRKIVQWQEARARGVHIVSRCASRRRTASVVLGWQLATMRLHEAVQEGFHLRSVLESVLRSLALFTFPFGCLRFELVLGA